MNAVLKQSAFGVNSMTFLLVDLLQTDVFQVYRTTTPRISSYRPHFLGVWRHVVWITEGRTRKVKMVISIMDMKFHIKRGRTSDTG